MGLRLLTVSVRAQALMTGVWEPGGQGLDSVSVQIPVPVQVEEVLLDLAAPAQLQLPAQVQKTWTLGDGKAKKSQSRFLTYGR
jgi:hypothetical protein